MLVTYTALLFFSVLLLVSAYGYIRYVRPARMLSQLETAAAPEPSGDPKPPVITSTIRRIGQYMPDSLHDNSTMQRDLYTAGFRSEAAKHVYLGLKGLLAVSFGVCAVMFQSALPPIPLFRLVIAFFAAYVGLAGPSFVLGHLARARKERLRLALPDALDLLVLSVEAGLGFDQALTNVARELSSTHKDLCDEFSLVNLEMRVGKSRHEALRNFADRTGEQEIQKLVSVLSQADRFGTVRAEALRSQADFLRVQRKHAAEERASKVGVKLVFPIFAFILPSMMVVSAGPGLLQLFKVLLPMMNTGQ